MQTHRPDEDTLEGLNCKGTSEPGDSSPPGTPRAGPAPDLGSGAPLQENLRCEASLVCDEFGRCRQRAVRTIRFAGRWQRLCWVHYERATLNPEAHRVIEGAL